MVTCYKIFVRKRKKYNSYNTRDNSLKNVELSRKG